MENQSQEPVGIPAKKPTVLFDDFIDPKDEVLRLIGLASELSSKFEKNQPEYKEKALEALDKLFENVTKQLAEKKEELRIDLVNFIDAVTTRSLSTWHEDLKAQIQPDITPEKIQEIASVEVPKGLELISNLEFDIKEIENVPKEINAQEKKANSFFRTFGQLDLTKKKQRVVEEVKPEVVIEKLQQKNTATREASIESEFIHPFEEEIIQLVQTYNKDAVQKRADLSKKFEGFKIRSVIQDYDRSICMEDFYSLAKKKDIALDRAVSLRLEVLKASKFDSNAIQTLQAGLSAFVRLKSLHLTFDNFSGPKEIDLLGFLVSLANLRYVEDLKVVIRDNANITDKVIEGLQLPLGSFDNITKLYLHFEKCPNITDGFIDHIQKQLSALKYLQLFSLSFANCQKLTYKAFSTIKKPVSNLKNLNQLALNFANCNVISHTKGALKPLKQILGSTKDMYHLTLNFEGCDGPVDKIFKRLRKPLPTYKHLNELNLHFSKCTSLTIGAFQYLEKSLPQISSVKVMSLDFSRIPHVNDACIDTLFKAMTTQNLTSLKLDVHRSDNLTDSALESFKNHILLTNKALFFLSLNFERCKNITDKGLSSLRQGFSYVPAMSVLELHFGGCPKITEDSLNEFASSITENKSLRQLVLDFNYNENLTDTSIAQLLNLETTAPQLTSLRFELQENKNITGKTLQTFESLLRSLKNLRIVSFDFTLCPKVPKDSINNFVNVLTEIPFVNFKTSILKHKAPAESDITEELEVRWEIPSVL